MAEPVVCTICETVDYPKRHTRGSMTMELVLWLTFIVPGVIYSVWRHTTREYVCKGCGRPTTVPINTPVGQRIAHSPERWLDSSEETGYLPPGDRDRR